MTQRKFNNMYIACNIMHQTSEQQLFRSTCHKA